MLGTPFAAPPVEARSAAIDLVNHAFRGDTAASLRYFLCQRDEKPWSGDLVHASLRLFRALAWRCRSNFGMLQLYRTLNDVELSDRDLNRRMGAQLILGHSEAADAFEITGLDAAGLDTAAFYNSGVASFNAAVKAAGHDFLDAMVAAICLWRGMLPEIGADDGQLIGIVAAELWSEN